MYVHACACMYVHVVRATVASTPLVALVAFAIAWCRARIHILASLTEARAALTYACVCACMHVHVHACMCMHVCMCILASLTEVRAALTHHGGHRRVVHVKGLDVLGPLMAEALHVERRGG